MAFVDAGFRMRVRTVMVGDVEFLRAYVAMNDQPESDVEGGIEIGRIAKNACRHDDAIYHDWVAVMQRTFEQACKSVPGMEGVKMFYRKPGDSL